MDTERTFVVTVGPHAPQLAFRAHNLTWDECRIVRRIVTNRYMSSEDYKLKSGCEPFLQGYQEPLHDENDGWVLVEFWSTNRPAMEKFTAHVNAEIKRMKECQHTGQVDWIEYDCLICGKGL